MVVNKLHSGRNISSSPSMPLQPSISDRKCCYAAAVLGRFVYALNLFCKEAYGMDYDVSDYWVYEFAKVGCNCSCTGISSCEAARALAKLLVFHNAAMLGHQHILALHRVLAGVAAAIVHVHHVMHAP